ncbi:MAG TPA: hypothetical protein VM901_11170 [Bdellovibrionota bacterium]|jgi:hypothetical protein|nr:hypothetical protein [Bdellovibrionota bacterium]
MATKTTHPSKSTKRGATSQKTTRKKVATKSSKSPTKITSRKLSAKTSNKQKPSPTASGGTPRESPSVNQGFNQRSPDQMPANVHPHSEITNDQRNLNKFAHSGTSRIQGAVRSRVRHQQGRRQS